MISSVDLLPTFLMRLRSATMRISERHFPRILDCSGFCYTPSPIQNFKIRPVRLPLVDGPVMKANASALSDRGLKRAGNEDQYLIDESIGLYMVCDGMGGHSAGEVAAEKAIGFASDYISSQSELLESAGERPDGYFRVVGLAEEAVQTASQKVYQLARTSAKYSGMGTTLTMLIIVDSKAVMAHVGDSRLYLKRGGEIHQLSVDHTLANELYLAGGMSREDVQSSRYQHVLTRSIGPQQSVLVDTLLFDLLPGDRFLLCSDGLSNYFKSPSVVAQFLGLPNIATAPDPLVDFAKQSGGSDNITAVVIETLADQQSDEHKDTHERLEALRASCLGHKLSVRRLLHLLTASTVIQCNVGRELVSMGDDCPGMFIVMEGAFRVVDDDIVEGERRAGDSFGQEMLIAPAKSSATLIATEPSKVLFVERKQFNRLIKRLPRLGNLLLRNLSRHLSERIVSANAPRPISLDDTGPL